MTSSKKKTLRAAILASIFAMSVCGSAWADSNYIPSTSSNEGAAKPFTPHLLMLDGWHTDINGNTVLTGQEIIAGMNSGTWFNDYGYNNNGENYADGKYVSSIEPVDFDDIDRENFSAWKLTKKEIEAIKKFKMSGGYVYGVNIAKEGETPNYVFNYNPYSCEEINGITVPEARPPQDSWTPWDQVTFYSTYELIGREIAWESEYRVAADDLLHQDDIQSISHSIDISGNAVNLVTTLTTYDNDTNSNRITSNSLDLTNAVNTVVNNRFTALEAGWTASVTSGDGAPQSEQITAGETLNFAVADSKNNLTVSMVGGANNKTVQFNFSANPEFDGVTVDSGNNVIDIGKSEDGVISVGTDDNKVVIDGTKAKITAGKVTVDGNAGHITGLTNKDWDGTSIVSGRAATEDQLRILQQNIKGDITTINQNIDTIQDNYVTNIEENNKNNLTEHSWTVTQNVTGNDDTTVKQVLIIEDYNTVNTEMKHEWYGDDVTVKVFDDRYKESSKDKIGLVETTIENIARASNLGDIRNVDGDINSKDGDDTYTNVTMVDVVNNLNDKVNKGWTAKVDGKYVNNVTMGDQQNFVSGENISLTISGYDIVVNTKKEVEFNSVTSNTVNVTNTLTVADAVTVNNEGITIENGDNDIVINKTRVDVGGNKINNVADGEISATSKDAVNGSQLYQEQQDRIAGDNMLSNRLDKLGNRVDKVGAGAAALAALHPLDFDPDDKLSFSAGVGNYGGETATALGAFYRPTEKVMFSAAGTMGNGENMVNMGVTFALDKTNNVSNSRVAMAREIQDLREQVAALTALVTQLAGRNNPALMDTVMFPDVPENHWAYDYIDGLQKRGIIEGYPDGNYGGDRSMTRYEYAAMLYRALEKGFPVDSRLLDEFDAELGRIRIDRIKGEDNDPNKTERVRVNNYQDRDDYGSKLVTVAAAK